MKSIEKLKLEIKRRMEKNDPAHDFEHIMRVYKNAQKILKRYGYSNDDIKIVSEAIRDHSFSRGMVPHSLEGKVLQDADRLDALGAVGIARAFAVGGSEKRPFYNKNDPFCKSRRPDDQNWTLDHFYRKLLFLEKKMNTKAAQTEARRRTKIMKKFLNDLKKEI